MKQTKNKTLLDRVKDAPVLERGRPGSVRADPDVAIAWLKGEIRFVQISRALWPEKTDANTATQVYTFLNQSLREAYRQGRIKIVE